MLYLGHTVCVPPPRLGSQRMLQLKPPVRARGYQGTPCFWYPSCTPAPGSQRLPHPQSQDQDPKGCPIPGPGSKRMSDPWCQDPKGCCIPDPRTRIPKDVPSHPLRFERLLQSAPAPYRTATGSLVCCTTQAKVLISALKYSESRDIQRDIHHASLFRLQDGATGPHLGCNLFPTAAVGSKTPPREGD